jgi:uncharacterized membrane protein required for colicin V production
MAFNLLVLIVFLAIVFKMVEGCKQGLVKEIISLVTLMIAAAVVVIIANGIKQYNAGEMVNVVIAILLLAALGIAHYLLGIVFFSAKMIVKLPIIKIVDKLAGILFGAAEVALFLWALFMVMDAMNLGVVENWVEARVLENSLLTWIYNNNYLAKGISLLMNSIEIPEALIP